MNDTPSQPNRVDVTTQDGKYRFFMRHDGSLGAERHGEPWIDRDSLRVPGINMFTAIAMELEAARAEIAALQAQTPKAQQVNDKEWKLLPVDLETHLHDFKNACTIARDNAVPATVDSDDPGYWSHQLRTIDRIETMIEQQRGAKLAPASLGMTENDDPSLSP